MSVDLLILICVPSDILFFILYELISTSTSSDQVYISSRGY